MGMCGGGHFELKLLRLTKFENPKYKVSLHGLEA